MAAVKELLRAEADGTLSFGDYTLGSKTKLNFREIYIKSRHFQRLLSLKKMECLCMNLCRELR